MRIAFVIYEGMTSLDFIGVYDPVTRLRTMGFIHDLEWDVCALSPEVFDGTGLHYTPTKVGPPLGDYDMVVVPGGYGTEILLKDEGFINWLRGAVGCKLKVSVCTGSLLLGAAGFLVGKKATSHLKWLDHLRPFCEAVVDQRVVEDGDVVTARGVSSSIDLGLYLCQMLAGPEVRERIRQQIDYQPVVP